MTDKNADRIAANRNEFLEALRSGKYAQIRHSYKTENGYCVIGLASQILDHHYNISDALGTTLEFECKLINWNDRECLTFGQIADKIEENDWK